MKNLHNKLRKSLLVFAVLLQTISFSVINISPTVLAEDTTATTSAAAVSPATCPSVTGTTAPTGAAAHTFTFNPVTCLWENAYYTWDPVTKLYTPLYSQTPVYNPATNTWDHDQWDYITSDGAYKLRVVSVPAAAPAVAAAATSGPAAAASSAGTGGGAQAQTVGSATISDTGEGSNNEITNNNTTDADLNITNNSSILTAVNSTALSGNALVVGNTNGGNAVTGDAKTVANVLNMLQSSWDPVGSDFSTFVANLYGNYTGDLLFDPTQVLSTGANSNNQIEDNSTTDLTVNIQDNGLIQNDLNLDAQSGNATVSGNTNGGNATSGDALALANLINMINSSIVSDQGFVGSINLFGQLNGDILLPSSLQALLMDTGANSNNEITDNSNTDIDVNETTDYSITNNTNLTASSGSALVQGNTVGGSAQTGTAETNLNQMNLINTNATGKKGLLVFVNVLGQWQGMILRVPTNGSIIGTGANSNNQITDNSNTNADININRDYEIVNNLNLNAGSGDATVSGNTNGGNATTGNANSTVNSLNMINSQIKFSDWFGVLFINVFGKWNGSFGVDTSAGGKGGGMPGGSGGSGGPQTSSGNTPSGSSLGTSTFASTVSSTFYSGGRQTGRVDASGKSSTEVSDEDKTSVKDAVKDVAAASAKKGTSLWVGLIMAVIALLFLLGDRIWGAIASWFASKK